jgi:thiol-disulfide isomerase/thioredoxin
MKLLNIITPLLTYILGLNMLVAQGIQFEQGTWDETLLKADKAGKLVFLDAYTTWCGPCKLLNKNTFSDAAVGSFYNQNFIAAKINMEAGEGPALAERYQVRAYPTLLFVDSKGNVVHRGLGYMGPEDFIKLGETALNPETQVGAMISKYNAGNREPKFVAGLLETLESAGDDRASEIGASFLESQTNFDNPALVTLLQRYVSDPTSKAFAYLATNQDKVFPDMALEDINDNIIGVYNRYLADKDLEMPAIENLIQQTFPNFKGDFLAKFKVMHYAAKGDLDGFLTGAIDWLNRYPSEDADFLNQMAWTFHENTEDATYLNSALQWALKSIKLKAGYNNLDTVAHLYADLGKKKEAKKFAKKAIAAAKKSGDDASTTVTLLQSLN